MLFRVTAEAQKIQSVMTDPEPDDQTMKIVAFVNGLVSRSCIDRIKIKIDYHEGHHGCFHDCGSLVIRGE
jgi:hypothetical protein